MSKHPETDALMIRINEGRKYDTIGPLQEHAEKLEIHRDMLRKELAVAVGKWANFVPCSHCVRIRATNGEQAEYCHPYEPKACRKIISDWLTATAAKGESHP